MTEFTGWRIAVFLVATCGLLTGLLVVSWILFVAVILLLSVLGPTETFSSRLGEWLRGA